MSDPIEHGRIIGRDGNNYRGNRQNRMAEARSASTRNIWEHVDG